VLRHNFCVSSQLDEVADQLAQQPLAVRHSSNRLLARAEKRGRVGIIAGVVGGVWMAVSTLRRYPRVRTSSPHVGCTSRRPAPIATERTPILPS
jgi:hypothetical protein